MSACAKRPNRQTEVIHIKTRQMSARGAKRPRLSGRPNERQRREEAKPPNRSHPHSGKIKENQDMEVGTLRLKVGLAEMLKGGVIMDVTNAEQAKIAEDAGAVAVMALE